MYKTFCSGVAVGAALVYALGGVHVRASRPQPDELTMPDHWVPFVATRVFHSAHGDQVAKEYRNSHGSTATYVQPETVGPITIHNADTTLTYARLRPNYWISYPLRAPIPVTPPTVAKYKSNSVSRLTETVASMPVYEVFSGSSQSGRIKTVPALNGLIVQMRMPNGYGDEVSDLVVQEPDAALFLPPAGVNLKRLDGPPVPSSAPNEHLALRKPH